MGSTQLETPSAGASLASSSAHRAELGRRLFLASFLALYFELLVIRYLSTEIRTFAYLKNLPLIATFLGIGMGMILGSRTERLRRPFAGLATFFFLMIWICTQTGRNHFGLPNNDYGIWNNYFEGGVMGTVSYFVFVGAFLYLVVRFFVPLGGMVGQYMAEEPRPLRAYAINLFGSFAGIALFTLVSFLGSPPWVWLMIGFLLLLPLLPKSYVAMGLLTFTVVLTATSFRPHVKEYWSPYYHILLTPGEVPSGDTAPAYDILSVNYDYHQKILNLSKDFLARHPDLEPNRSATASYDLPFKLAPRSKDVLIVGAGTGNDVAAALRNGADHVDAVEIDPIILKLGKRFHPEHPYDSPRVTAHVNDARAFFKQTRHKYDLILFGYLDSHTMFSSFSSLRLDNYVYTKESFEEARALLKPGGSLILAFASGESNVTLRIFRTLEAAFGTKPRAYDTGYDSSGVVFVEGAAQESNVAGYREITKWADQWNFGIASDSWPFLYLPKHRIPWPVWSVLVLVLIASFIAVRKLVSMQGGVTGMNVHFFLLGAGFLLLETKGVTELSLLFGSTWAVNSVVIAAFLCMALLSNLLVMKWRILVPVAYAALILTAMLTTIFPYAELNSLSLGIRMLVAGAITAVPVFFSGIVFSRSLSESTNANQALGVNLIGAIFGGALESTVMIGGTGILGPIAILLYIGSAVPLVITKSHNAAVTSAVGTH
ncbi:MAG: methyltransferase domain-containing protein [Terriglobia bacterium]|nr:methyltransferase domain-containing protein [Terriglobia bacterium]